MHVNPEKHLGWSGPGTNADITFSNCYQKFNSRLEGTEKGRFVQSEKELEVTTTLTSFCLIFMDFLRYEGYDIRDYYPVQIYEYVQSAGFQKANS